MKPHQFNIQCVKNKYTVVFIGFILLLFIAILINNHEADSFREQNIPHTDKQSEEMITQHQNVDVTDFTNTAFIGDSRTQGLMLYSGLTDCTFYTETGLTVKDVVSKPVVKDGDKKITIIDALKNQSFDKIYIMLGINELGWAYPELFSSAYSKMIDEIKISEPDAKIIIQSILPVNRELIKNPKDHINNERIFEYNKIIKKICSEKDLSFIDTYSIMCDENGNLFADATTDGIHLNKEYCERWLAFLKGAPIDE